MIKEDAPELLEKAFQKKSWVPQTIVVSGNTDCYQPAERKLKITRRLLEVCLKYRNPVSLITKNSLIQRDIDILSQLAALDLTRVQISITTMDEELRRIMEPRTASAARRFQTVEKLSQAGIYVAVGVAPIIPGLNDKEIPAILERAYNAGAKSAFHTLLRLAYDNKILFVNWLRENLPEKADRVIALIKDTRDGGLNQSQFGLRMRGSGKYADSIHELFEVSAAKFKLQSKGYHLRKDLFIRYNEQLRLF
jgi:DNA repair photolyase